MSDLIENLSDEDLGKWLRIHLQTIKQAESEEPADSLNKGVNYGDWSLKLTKIVNHNQRMKQALRNIKNLGILIYRGSTSIKQIWLCLLQQRLNIG